jgi:bis(5'-adenosyl)-triphosphatase
MDMLTTSLKLLLGRSHLGFLVFTIAAAYSMWTFLRRCSHSASLDGASRSTKHVSVGQDIQFGGLAVKASKVFFAGSLSNESKATSSGSSFVALQHLSPIMPGHMVVISHRQVSRFYELNMEELRRWVCMLRTVQPLAESQVEASASNIALKDGPQAGPPVSQLHTHIIPRKSDDMVGDGIYSSIDHWEPWICNTEQYDVSGECFKTPERSNPVASLVVPPDKERQDRTGKMMEDEAIWYREIARQLLAISSSSEGEEGKADLSLLLDKGLIWIDSFRNNSEDHGGVGKHVDEVKFGRFTVPVSQVDQP